MPRNKGILGVVSHLTPIFEGINVFDDGVVMVNSDLSIFCRSKIRQSGIKPPHFGPCGSSGKRCPAQPRP